MGCARQLRPRGIAAKVGDPGQDVYRVTDKVGIAPAITPRYRRANDEPVLTAPAVEEQLVSHGQQR